MQPFLRERGTGVRGSSRTKPATRTPPPPAPANSSGCPQRRPSMRGGRQRAQPRGRLGDASLELPSCAPSCSRVTHSPPAHYGSRSSALLPLLFLTGGAEGRGLKGTRKKAVFPHCFPRLIAPTHAEQKHFQPLPARVGTTFASPEEPGGRSGGECASQHRPPLTWL